MKLGMPCFVEHQFITIFIYICMYSYRESENEKSSSPHIFEYLLTVLENRPHE
jgi:hypothetical protein